MKTSVLALALAAIGAGQVRSEPADLNAWDGKGKELYWMIGESNDIPFDYAVVYAALTAQIEGKTWTTEDGFGDVGQIALPNTGEGGWEYEPKRGSFTTTWDILTELGEADFQAYSFYIELLQWDDSTNEEIRKGVSAVSTYDDLVNQKHILGDGMIIPNNLVVWAPPTAAPEPTGALLLLLGSGLLALRRPRRCDLNR